ncbi:energy-coupling factor transporter transmembrane protein EcfT [Streptococcus sp. zg-86]|uniref:Energy-coupling factor transporter transmembrane protein EcfT n=2 Tax=Streptococcus TaxID=1301 RepID=A0A6I4R947_9STRE|nr:energy-coupling factor transporter transmembrane protein EcfT [Streptococcus sp. zg-86]MTB90371.1 energy-coupling factor transporter transmembrane protein EcfT [Streptococcus sp. zg-36]MWV56049.1 energy-coupling factor transporter transmembrane protein EcfT [Streptococcus sp. zg-70]
MSLYEEKHSFLNRLSSLTKIVYVLAAIVIPILANEWWCFGITIVLSALLLAHSKVISRTFPIVSLSSFVILTVAIIQGLFRQGNETPVLTLGPVTFYQEGLLFALGIALNIYNIILAFCVLILTTKSSDMIEDLVRKGFSPRMGYVFISLFQLIPQMTSRMATITDAQRSRGMETEGSLLVRIKAFLPLVSPVIMSSFIETKERAIALEVRGFNSKAKKTFITPPVRSVYDRPIQLMCVAGLIAALIWRLV